MKSLCATFVSALVACSVNAAAPTAATKFPNKGVVTIGSGPLPLLVHYVEGTGRKVQISLRNLSFAPPDLKKSQELKAIASRACGRGDIVDIRSARISAEATGLDAAGIGRFVWLISGKYSTDGNKWQFAGTVSAKDDLYNFNKAKDGERAFWAEVSTRLGSQFDGKQFWIQITGSLPVSISGTCSLNSAGQAIV